MADAGYIDQAELKAYLDNQKYLQNAALADYVKSNITPEQVNDYFKNNKRKDINGMYQKDTGLVFVSDDKFITIQGQEPGMMVSKGEDEDRESVAVYPFGLFFEGPKQTNLGIRLNEDVPIHVQNTYGIYQAGPKGIKLNDWNISPEDSNTKLCFKNSKTNFEYCLGSSANPNLPKSYIHRRY